MKSTNHEGYKIICQNKKAHFEYELGERLEAGLILTGSEVKSLRQGKANLIDAFVRIVSGEPYLVGANINLYPQAFYGNHDPLRRRKILLHKKEIKRLIGKTQEKGFSLIPTRLYFKNGLAKVEVSLAKGKKLHDKRQALKDADSKRDLARAVREYNR
ncbi:MAG: SsrA-binding protein SmpB [Deltaproteobacteria bacterium]|jgi:SsrA-binding protein|nr:SsrA-binding protein SmpB [Deltaproteobacteria bacterium]